MSKDKPQILLTNDDGIDSPGLWAAAEALSGIGYVWVVAPRDQASGTGRSMPLTSDGIITPRQISVNGKGWTVYAVGGTPAQTVQHGILEVLENKPDLIVAGINYGNNAGPGVTVSGTVGAALEGASQGIPSIAISLDTDIQYHFTHSEEINFEVAAHFTAYFAQRYLDGQFDPAMMALKIEIPWEATPETPWEVTRLATTRYYISVAPKRDNWEQPARTGYTIQTDLEQFSHNSDVYTLLAKRRIAVTPLTLDMTAPVDFKQLDHKLRSSKS